MSHDSFTNAALLRPTHPPPVPPKPAALSKPPKPSAPMQQVFKPLPGPLHERPPATSRAAFPTHIQLKLLPPTAVHRTGTGSVISNISARPLAAQVTVAYLSPSQTFVQILDQLLTAAAASFGLDLTKRTKWHYALRAGCEGHSGGVDAENLAFVLSASGQGGWMWCLSLVETARSCRGIWESLETFSVPRIRRLDGGFFDRRAGVGTVREV